MASSSGNAVKLEALPKGFRFRPTDEELVSHYLRLKINGNHSAVEVIPEVDVCKWEPWDLPALSVIKSTDQEWFFFCPRDKKYSNGHRSNRATEAGYWKATGKDRTIKSRKSPSSGHSNSHIIGMKKTLVFHRGRAPKGERTNWIMHEYRPTEPDLDGTAPGQGDYVLCRLFHKVDEKLEKCDDVEHTRLSPSTNKSSPDEVSSDMLGDPALIDVKTIKKPEDMSMWWTDQANYLIPLNQVPVVSCALDGIDHSRNVTDMMEVYMPLQEVPMSGEATQNHFDEKIMDMVQPDCYSDLKACVGSPFADDFGNEQNALHFQDGTSEQDASLSELLEGLQNPTNNFSEDSTGHRHSAVTSDGFNHDDKEQRTASIFKDQIFPKFFNDAPTAEHLLNRCAVDGVDSSTNTFRGSCDKPVDEFHDTKSIKNDCTPTAGTGIRIRSRHLEAQLNTMNVKTHGTAPRRIHLGGSLEPMTICSQKSNGQDDESSCITEATEDSGNCISMTQESEDKTPVEDKETAQTCGPKQDVKHSVQNEKTAFLLPTSLSTHRGKNNLTEHTVWNYIFVFLLVVFLGMFASPSLLVQYT